MEKYALKKTENEEFVTLEEACEILRLSKPSVVKLLWSGEIPGKKFGRFWRISRRGLLNSIDGETNAK